MNVKLQRRGNLFYMVEKNEEIPITRDVYFQAVTEKIKMFKDTGKQRYLTYYELLEVLEGILGNDRILKRENR